MFEPLTKFLPGESGADVSRTKAFAGLTKEIYKFAEDTKRELNLFEYLTILSGISVSAKTDVSRMDGRMVAAMLVFATRAGRFGGSGFSEYVGNGCVEKWLSRLREIDLNLGYIHPWDRNWKKKNAAGGDTDKDAKPVETEKKRTRSGAKK